MFSKKTNTSPLKRLRSFVSSLGPGFITGAADDDPSGVVTYSIAGAQFGYGLAWMSFFTLPFMIAVQEACARIGYITGSGLAGVIRKHYPRWFLSLAVSLLAFANIINIGADLGAMAGVISMVVGLPWWIWLVVVTVLIVALEIVVPYRRYEGILRLLGLVLLTYVATAVIVTQDIFKVIFAIITPNIEFTLPFIAAAVGFLGTTISPYLFFWQAAEEVEDEIALNKIHGFGMGTPKFRPKDLKRIHLDTNFGMLYSQIISLAIIVTTAETLNKSGLTAISSAQQAALALRPIAGEYAYMLFALGIIGVGLQSIPVLAGSLAYAVSEVFQRQEGLGKSFSQARFFYYVIGAAAAIGACLNFFGVNPIHALFYSAIVNGVIAIPLILVVTNISSNSTIMRGQVSGNWSKILCYSAAGIMALAVFAMIFLGLKPNQL